MTSAPPSKSSSASTSTSSSSSPSSSTSVENETAGKTFSWENQWYPVQWESDMPRDRPYEVRLFGRSYAVFKDKLTGLWAACDDLCPHRLAPLSEGRLVESKATGQTLIECAYHGWRFSCEDGTCVDIPNVPTGSSIPPRASITRFYPVTVSNIGLIFLWLGPRELADESKLPMDQRVAQADKKRVTTSSQFKRSFPFSYDTLVENLIDPSHVNWAHHGESQSSRNAVIRSNSLTLLLDHEITDLANGVFRASRTSDYSIMTEEDKTRFKKLPNNSDSYITFHAPGHVHMMPMKKIEGRPDVHFMLWAVPNDVNECTLFLEALILDLPFMPRLFFFIVPKWMTHTRLNIFLDGDSPLLQLQRATISDWVHSQDQSQSAAAPSASSSESTSSSSSSESNGNGVDESTPGQSITHVVWQKAFVPSPGGWDSLILTYRKWYDRNEHLMPFPNNANLTKAPIERLSHQLINDHLKWHVDECPSCQTALRNARIVAYVLAAAAVILAAASLTMISATAFANVPLLKPAIACMLLSIVAFAVTLRLLLLVKSMTYTDQAKESYFNDKMIVVS